MADYAADAVDAGEDIKEAGCPVTVVISTGSSYNAAAGAKTKTSTSVPTYGVLLPKSEKRWVEFTKEQVAGFSQMMLLAANDLNAASVKPKAGDKITVGSETFFIAGLAAVAPSGIAIIYKVGLTNG